MTAHRTTVALKNQAGTSKWTPRCACGWTGTPDHRRSNAARAAALHLDNAENDEDDFADHSITSIDNRHTNMSEPHHRR